MLFNDFENIVVLDENDEPILQQLRNEEFNIKTLINTPENIVLSLEDSDASCCYLNKEGVFPAFDSQGMNIANLNLDKNEKLKISKENPVIYISLDTHDEYKNAVERFIS